MTEPSARATRATGGTDAWSIPAYLLAGMLLGGVPGLLLDRLFATSYLLLLGLLVGTGLAGYLIWFRLEADARASEARREGRRP